MAVLLSLMVAATCSAQWFWRNLADPDVGEQWVQPARGTAAKPIWGHAKGLRVGLWPMGGPRGLLRIYTPYLGHEEGRVINFVAIEPIPKGQTDRGLSELEPGLLDDMRGKRMWSVDSPDDPTPKSVTEPARGVIESIDGVETLTVFVPVERFDNGAHVYVRLRFRADQPYEVGIATYAWPDSAELAYCISTATMGNYARLRTLHLAQGTKTAMELWPDYDGDAFAPHARIPLKELHRMSCGSAILIATPNETNPEEAEYAPGTRSGWRYEGKVATQYWRRQKPDPALVALVNGRMMYWASQSPIPGGIAFENVELAEPFHSGQEYWFGVTTKTPAELLQPPCPAQGATCPVEDN